MNRRDFIRLQPGAADTAEVSCERLFIHFSNAHSAGNAGEFLQRTAVELATGARRLLLKDAFWLEERKLAAAIAPVLDDFRARGGVIDRL